ncbi:hypothetical protein EJ05DRAFT_96595 [Pseudovirgaria hyperparasitica]|uniref:Cora-domain-containing protein n=1 Tax=Pseudovirgaria hyperparasitica TaxID=470096 RepID=A0A6A6W073_9PEZI|nr:uncharacterized protein EJ05DRAFT_96595 [Pseudovirgaria hyperparasitica]KAF2756302.1 hypothetical protein EJ05DRAFT_96595 [Pseudovirgaria hyperparasitica]
MSEDIPSMVQPQSQTPSNQPQRLDTRLVLTRDWLAGSHGQNNYSDNVIEVTSSTALQMHRIVASPPLPPEDYDIHEPESNAELIALPLSSTHSVTSDDSNPRSFAAPDNSFLELSPQMVPLPASIVSESRTCTNAPFSRRTTNASLISGQNPRPGLYQATVETVTDSDAAGGVHNSTRDSRLSSVSTNSSGPRQAIHTIPEVHRAPLTYVTSTFDQHNQSELQVPYQSSSDRSYQQFDDGTEVGRRTEEHRYPQRDPRYVDLVKPPGWYRDRIRILAEEAPRLRTLVSTVCRHHKNTNLAVFDYDIDGNSIADQNRVSDERHWDGNAEAFADEFKFGIQSGTTRRLLFVQDLSPGMIDLLGSTFQINPECFSDHLYQSGYGDSQVDSQAYSDWESLPSIKDHTTFEWYRPVLPLFPIKKSFRDALLDKHAPLAKCHHAGCGKTHALATNSNIWRRPWKLSPFPTTSGSADDKSPMGWCERVTVWTKVFGGCLFIIILLDPLPLLDQTVPKIGERRRPEIVNRRTNTPVSRRRYNESQRQSEESNEGFASGIDDTASSRQNFAAPNIVHRSVKHYPFAPFQQMIARGPSAVADDHLLATTVIDDIRKPKSTWVESCQLSVAKHIDPLTFLFGAIHSDIDGVLRLVRSSIDTIRTSRQDQALVQENVWYWRELLNQYEDKIERMKGGLEELIRFIFVGAERSKADFASHKHYVPERTRDHVEATIQRLDEVGRMVAVAQDQLRVELQMIDSRRSIAEAESVSKLTELAFIFIPVTFAASLFSMQIKELGDGVPVWQFVLVAISFVMLAYIVRLSIRSESVVEFKKECFDQARRQAGLAENTPIPTRAMLKWALPRLFTTLRALSINLIRLSFILTAIFAAIAAILSPIITMWTRRMNPGFSAVITVILLLLDGIALWPVVSVLTNLDDFKNELKTWRASQDVRYWKTKRQRQDEEGVIGEPRRHPQSAFTYRQETGVEMVQRVRR